MEHSLTATMEESANLNSGEFKIVKSLTNFVFSPLISCNYIIQKNCFHMNVIRPTPSWTLLATGASSPSRPPDRVMLYSFDRNSMSKITRPIKFYLIEKKHIPYFLLKCLKHVTFWKILGCTYCRLHYFNLFKTAWISLFDTCNKCDIERKYHSKYTEKISTYNCHGGKQDKVFGFA